MIYGQIFSFNFLGDRKKSFRLPGGGGQREEKLWRKGKKWNIIIYHVQSHFVSVATYSEYTFTRHLTRRKTNKSKPVNPFPVYVGLFRKKSQLHIQWQRMFGLGRKKNVGSQSLFILVRALPVFFIPPNRSDFINHSICHVEKKWAPSVYVVEPPKTFENGLAHHILPYLFK